MSPVPRIPLHRLRALMVALLIAGTTTGIVALSVTSEYAPPVDVASTTTGGTSNGDGPVVRRLWTSSDAVRAARDDARTLPPEMRRYVRYLAEFDGNVLDVMLDSIAVNWNSRGSDIVPPIPLFDFHLVRIDVRDYAREAPAGTRQRDIRDWLRIWEDFRFDPSFNLLVTRDTARFAEAVGRHLLPSHVGHKIVREVIPAHREKYEFEHKGGVWKAPDDSGREFELEARWYRVMLEFKEKVIEHDSTELLPGDPIFGDGVDVLHFDAPHLDLLAYRELQRLTDSEAPIVDARYFRFRALRTIKNFGSATKSKLFETLFGGLYYDFRFEGAGKAKAVLGRDTKATDLDLFFQLLGVGNIRGGETAQQLLDRVRSEMRTILFKSGITKKPRVTSLFHVQEKEGAAGGAITGDIFDEDVDIGDRSYANLRRPRIRAREGIFPGPGGVPVDVLFKEEDGSLQDEVPFNVVSSLRLQAPINCMTCHARGDHFQPLGNDVTRLTDATIVNRDGTFFKIFPFGDLSAGREAFDEGTVAELRSLYRADPSLLLRRARDDVARVTLKMVGRWPGGGTQAHVHEQAMAYLEEEDRKWWSDPVLPRDALHDCGISVPEAMKDDDATAMFNRLLPPDPRSRVGNVYVESPTVSGLRAGIGQARSDFALVQAHLAERFQKALAVEGKR